MTTVGFISDIHSNLEALETVLDDMPPVDTLICLGDIIGYGPYPSECLSLVRDEVDVCVIGNHELGLIEGYEHYRGNKMAYEGLRHSESELSNKQQEWLNTLPEMTTVDNSVKLVHSHPDPSVRWKAGGYIHNGQFPSLVSHLDECDVLTFGHTHNQHYVDMSDFQSHGIILNPGSVGQPRDNDSRAAYATVDLTNQTCTLHRVEYDIETVQEQIAKAGLPQKTGNRLAAGQ